MQFAMTISKFFIVALALLMTAGVDARNLQLSIDKLSHSSAQLENFKLSLDWPENAKHGDLHLQVNTLNMPALAFSARTIDWHCLLEQRAEGEWFCSGDLQLPGKKPMPLAISYAASGMTATLAIERSRVSVEAKAATPDLTKIQLERLPIIWLQALSKTLWEQAQWRDGQLSGAITISNEGNETLAVETDLALRTLAVDTPDGLVAAAGLNGRVRGTVNQSPRQTALDLNITLNGGELLAGSLYVPLPKTPVKVEVVASANAGQAWRLPHLSWSDGHVLRVQGSANLDEAFAAKDLSLTLSSDDLTSGRDRYLSGFLAPAGLPDLLLSGGVRANVQLRDGDLYALAVEAKKITAIDPRQRFILAGLDGDLRWSDEASAQRSRLVWDNAALYGIGLGAAQFDLESAEGEVRLLNPSQMSVLQGKIDLQSLRWQPPSKKRGTRFQLGVAMHDLDLASLSQRLGWPPFTGSLNGSIPAARYERGVLSLDGGLTMQLFEGEVRLSELVMERPFGIAPTLSAGVVIEDVDLQPLTAAFGFGTITGRLDGRIDKIRLLDWSPVAFSARLDTDRQWKGKRRISQRAVEDISSVAGSGLIAGLQAKVLKFFDDFGYARIGLGCTLRDNVCRMDGLSSGGDGYTIVEGAGLPRIQVVGFRRRVDWPMLVARLKTATDGQAPLVE